MPVFEASLCYTLVLSTDFIAQPALCVVDGAALAEVSSRIGLLLSVSPKKRTDFTGALTSFLDPGNCDPVVALFQLVG